MARYQDGESVSGARGGGITHPLDGVPGYGELVEVAPNVYWSRIPMPGKLDHINVWLLRDDDGVSVIDTGMYTSEAESAWTSLIGQIPGELAIDRVLVTHMHPDHVGMAGWLVNLQPAQFWMTRMEYLTCRTLESQSLDEGVPESFTGFHRAAGWPAAAIRSYRGHYGNFGKRVYPLPRTYHRLEHGQSHIIGGHKWRVFVGSGHSPEHACFYCKELKLLISGDQVLPRISSNVSVTPTEPSANPMADWLASLRRLRAEIPNDVLVLPAHQECFMGLHERIDALIAEQEGSFEALRELLRRRSARVVDLFSLLFSRPIPEDDPLIFSLATGEAQACLNYLWEANELTCSVDAHGVCWYRRSGI
ncbi:MBL fold metallo-hydrolase [Marinobacter sp.]|uniref:MBL fold metallo-hydrolase n=1 Tax=Marinobacter sp. TaxID=50741 RepID=UPI000C410172|nr:MBL fold metallo-hydrolase [Marinobacter sp.]MBE97364.1 MBL fold metallo-hydrolase [Marinobacter sp.]|tara:strand:- start:281 stop:1369 length:1089 start_codon:yes stop_codon:yes gene_type:complete